MRIPSRAGIGDLLDTARDTLDTASTSNAFWHTIFIEAQLLSEFSQVKIKKTGQKE
jgi:hypothetical protein